MDENKIFTLINNNSFIEKFLNTSSRKEMFQLFEEQGEHISEEELDDLIVTVEKALQLSGNIPCEKLNEDSMEIVAGGNFDRIEDCIARKTLFKREPINFLPL